MFLQNLARSLAVLGVAVMTVACSSKGAGSSDSAYTGAARSSDCERNRRSCIYEGRYESGERDYAESEARRLNQAQLNRMKRW